MIFTTNKKPKKIFPRGKGKEQRAAIKRRYEAVEVTSYARPSRAANDAYRERSVCGVRRVVTARRARV